MKLLYTAGTELYIESICVNDPHMNSIWLSKIRGQAGPKWWEEGKAHIQTWPSYHLLIRQKTGLVQEIDIRSHWLQLEGLHGCIWTLADCKSSKIESSVNTEIRAIPPAAKGGSNSWTVSSSVKKKKRSREEKEVTLRKDFQSQFCCLRLNTR